MKPKAKLNNVGLRLDDDELAQLQRLARHFGLRPTETLRMIVKHEADAIPPVTTKKD